MAPSGVDSRFLQANERTLLAWIRTGLGLAGFGFVLAKSKALLGELGSPPAEGASGDLHAWLGLGFVACAAITVLVALVRFQRVHHAIVTDRPVSTSAATPVVLTLATLAMVVLLGAWLVVQR